MTNLNDLDRALAEFLEDGPNTAPEAPVIAAMAHARTTPRRPDPLRRFRPDVMAPRRTGLGARPGLVFAGLALVIALAGVAVVGSRGPQDGILPMPSGSIAPAATPTATPTVIPSIGPAPFSRPITMLVSAGKSYKIQISDTTGDLVDARSVQPGDGSTVRTDELQIVADPSDPKSLILTWQGTPCESNGSLDVEERGHNFVVRREQCGGDQLPLDRIIRLQFATQVDPTWSYTLLYESFTQESVLPAESSAP